MLKGEHRIGVDNRLAAAIADSVALTTPQVTAEVYDDIIRIFRDGV
jgi:hypothetical protein